MADVKNVSELLDFGEKAAEQAKAVLADGKVDLWDLPKLAPLLPSFKAAIEGVGDVPAEVMDMDAAEAKMLLEKAVGVILKWAEVVASVKP